MTDDALPPLSKAEWTVMKIVWQLQKAVAREVYTVAAEENEWSAATVKTLLRRLVQKGYVHTTPVGNGFVYRPAQSASTSLQTAVEGLVGGIIEGATAPVIAHLVRHTQLSSTDLDELQALIDEKKLAIEQGHFPAPAKRSATKTAKNSSKKGRQ
jgi:predicted transcriptional regulator